MIQQAIAIPDARLRAVRAFALTLMLAVLATVLPVAATSAAGGVQSMINVIVREGAGAGATPERAIENLGGTVGRQIGLINGFTATVPAGSLDSLRDIRGVASVTPDAPLTLLHAVDSFDGATDTGSLYNTQKSIKAHDFYRNGITGQGIDVALIDSGVVPVDGLSAPGKVINGPDLSFESQTPELYSLDTYGHGTHMAGIIAGRGNGVTSSNYTSHDSFVGIAPDSRIVNLKVANTVGATDVSQVLAAIDWVVQHRNDNGMNIRVLNLAFGTDGVQSYLLDPLAYAVEVAWRKGIVVVAAAGNSGFGSSKLNNPAYDPYVIAVGANDPKGTFNVDDDVIPDWSSRGDGTRNPDVVAPGKSIVSLRNTNSFVDMQHPEGRVNGNLFRGSGTSQSAAVVAGAAALLLSQRPGLTPDQVKRILMTTATPLPAADVVAQGSGMINLKAAMTAATPEYVQTWPLSTGTGSLEGARGSAHVAMGESTLSGEQDIFGNAWNGATWSGQSWSGTTWSGGTWNGATWSGSCWCGTTWSGATWSGATWSGATWSGATWSGATWSGATWSGATWSGATWSGSTWSASIWGEPAQMISDAGA